MKPGIQLILVGVLAAGAGLVGGYFLWGSGGPSVAADQGRELPIGRSPLRASGEGAEGGSRLGAEDPAGSLSGGDGTFGFLDRGAISKGAPIEEILDEPGPVGRWGGVLRIALEGSDEEVEAALEKLQELPQEVDTIVSKFFLYSRYGGAEPELAMESLKDLPEDDRDLAARSVMGSWASEDPVAAAAYLKGLEDEEGNLPGNRDAMEALVNEWSRADPKAALEWSLDLGDGSRDRAVSEVLKRWAWADPEAAGAAALEMPPGDERKNFFSNIARSWAKRDYAGALSWAESLPAKEAAGAMSLAVGQWAGEEPAAAAMYSWNLVEGEARDHALRTAALRWSQSEPEAAANWMMARADGKGEERAIQDMIRNWTREDGMAASSWVANQAPGPSTDQAIVGLAREVSGKDPEGAAIWVSAIGDAEVREGQVKSVAQHWLKKDPEAARAWISSVAISEEVRSELLAR